MPNTITATVDPARSRVEARTEHEHRISMDADPPEGEDSAAGPKEALLAALAGCTSMDVASLLRKKRQVAETYEIEVSGETTDAHPRVFTTITVEHRLSGAVEAEALRRSIELSATRYCPVSAMLSAVATIEHRYQLTSEDGTSQEALVVVTGPSGTRVSEDRPVPVHDAVRSS
ncbi:MAG: OsmC family protein [Chloroflexi bacterium]|nr:OsmC family protein [Chloroflexota bacterium]